MGSPQVRFALLAATAAGLVFALILGLGVVSPPAPTRLAAGQAATPNASDEAADGATPAAAPDAAQVADLQTRVAVLSTEVAVLGGGDDEALVGRLGGGRAGFDERYGQPVAFPGDGQVVYDLADLGQLTVTFADDAATALTITPFRAADTPLDEADAADFPIDDARQVIADFAPADAAFGEQGAGGEEVALAIPGTSEALAGAVAAPDDASAAVPDAAGCAPSGGAAGTAAFTATLTTPTEDTVSAVTLSTEAGPAAGGTAEGGPAVLAPSEPRRSRVRRGGGANATSSLGGNVNVNGIQIEAPQVRPDASGSVEPAPDHSLLAVELSVANDSDRALDYDLVDFQLVDGRGREITAICGGEEPAITRGRLEPGETIEGWVTFQVPDAFAPERFVFVASGAQVGFLLR